MKSIKFLSTVACVLLVSMAFAQNGTKQANFKSVEANLQNLNTQNVNTDVPLSAEQQAINQQRQSDRAGQTFQTRTNPQLTNQNIQAPAGSTGAKITVKTTANNPSSNFTPTTNVQLTQAQKKARIKALLQNLKSQ